MNRAGRRDGQVSASGAWRATVAAGSRSVTSKPTLGMIITPLAAVGSMRAIPRRPGCPVMSVVHTVRRHAFRQDSRLRWGPPCTGQRMPARPRSVRPVPSGRTSVARPWRPSRDALLPVAEDGRRRDRRHARVARRWWWLLRRPDRIGHGCGVGGAGRQGNAVYATSRRRASRREVDDKHPRTAPSPIVLPAGRRAIFNGHIAVWAWSVDDAASSTGIRTRPAIFRSAVAGAPSVIFVHGERARHELLRGSRFRRGSLPGAVLCTVRRMRGGACPHCPGDVPAAFFGVAAGRTATASSWSASRRVRLRVCLPGRVLLEPWRTEGYFRGIVRQALSAFVPAATGLPVVGWTPEVVSSARASGDWRMRTSRGRLDVGFAGMMAAGGVVCRAY